jgi:hypothetical protein
LALAFNTAAGRAEFERRIEARRQAEDKEEEEWKPLRRGWCLGSEEFKKQMLDKIDGELGEHHSGQLKRESAEAKAERIIEEELRRLKWSSADLKLRLKSHPAKLQIASRQRGETTLPIRWVAERLNLGTWKSATTRLHTWKRQREEQHVTMLIPLKNPPLFSGGPFQGCWLESNQAQFGAVQKLPADILACFQVHGCRQRQGDIHE